MIKRFWEDERDSPKIGEESGVKSLFLTSDVQPASFLYFRRLDSPESGTFFANLLGDQRE